MMREVPVDPLQVEGDFKVIKVLVNRIVKVIKISLIRIEDIN
jgi:hypothetical protein